MKRFLWIIAATALFILAIFVSFNYSEFASGSEATSPQIDREAQRAEAIEKRDASLLPLCTDEDLADRHTEPNHPPSLDPWDNPGCRSEPTQSDQGAWGAKSEPGYHGRSANP